MTRATTLRLSLFVSLGLVPLACGGTTQRNEGDDTAGNGNGGGSGGASGGMTGSAGKPVKPNKPNGAGGSGSGGTLAVGTGGGSASCGSGKLNPINGLEYCGQGFWHRPKAVACDVPDAEAVGGAGPTDLLPPANGQGCNDDADCRGFDRGYCDEYSGDCFEGFGGQSGECLSGCTQDADCGAGRICICDGTAHGGHCESSTCGTDADCAAGSLCASLLSYGTERFTCTDPRDECHSDAQCDKYESCDLEPPATYRRCVETGICGRPFLVQAEARVAPVVADRAWSAAAPVLRVDHLTKPERAAQAAHWTKMGQMEHASIAAFARFQLQLLALGAPPELVDACTQALSDETAHTKLCFSLASAYAGRAIGPGTLDIDQSLSVASLADVVELVILEGCFGETSAALEALQLRDAASDAVIVSAYAQIAADEQRHAELAFRFVQWALARGDGTVRQRVARAVASPPPQPSDVHAVTLPCLEALLRLPEPEAIRAPANLPVI